MNNPNKYEQQTKIIKGMVNNFNVKSLLNGIQELIDVTTSKNDLTDSAKLDENYKVEEDRYHGMYDGYEEEASHIEKDHSIKKSSKTHKKKSKKKNKILGMSKSEIVNGVIYSEVLGKPKSLRKR